jgi:hypothetical protein
MLVSNTNQLETRVGDLSLMEITSGENGVYSTHL